MSLQLVRPAAVKEDGLMFCSVSYLFFSNDFCQTNVNIYRTKLRQIFRVYRTTAVDDQNEVRFLIPQGDVVVETNFCGPYHTTELQPHN